MVANWLIIQKVSISLVCTVEASVSQKMWIVMVKVDFIFLLRWLKFGKKQVIAFIIQPSVLPPLPFSVSSQNKLNLVSPILSFPKFYFLSVSVNTEILFLVKLTKFNDLGYVGVSARHSNQFCVSVNTERLSSVKVI